VGLFSRMPAPSKFTVAQWAAYLLPVAKAVFLGQLDLKDGLLKDILDSGIDLLSDDAKDKLTAFLKTKPDAVRDVLDQHLLRHTGAVLGRMVRRYAEEQTMEKYRPLLIEVAEEVPAAWSKYHASEEAGIQTLRGDLFTQLALGALVPGALAPQHDTSAIIAFFRWAAVEQNMLGPLMPGLTPPMADWIAQNVSRQLLIDLCQDTKEGNAAWKESMLRLGAETHVKLIATHAEASAARSAAEVAAQNTQRLLENDITLLGPLVEMMKGKTKEDRLRQYKSSLLNAFSAYQELALGNYAAADQTCSDIWDIFVHPACSQQHLRPEDMDAAQMEAPPRLPAADLLPLLAQDDHLRTVLLADPGMGKSTLIQSLIAHLASGRPLAGAPALNGLLPIPLILRDLVPLLPQDQVESWTWDSLLTVLLEHYKRDETSSPLCEAYKGHEAEFRQLIHRSAHIFFLIDGLDEIGDLVKRRKIVQCIQDGIRAVSKEARWLITSRVIGYEDAVMELLEGRAYYDPAKERKLGTKDEDNVYAYPPELEQLVTTWEPYKLGKQIIALDDKDKFWSAAAPEDDKRDAESKIRFVDSLTLPVVNGYFYRYIIAQRLYLAPFDNSRQDAFTSRWFRQRHSTDHSRELMREVRAHHHDGVRIISRVPNLLCMMNMLKRSGKPLPDGRAALYDEIVKAYLGGIDSTYRLNSSHGHTCPFEVSERRFLLSYLGAHMQMIRTAVDGLDSEDEEDKFDGNILIPGPKLLELFRPTVEKMLQDGRVKSPLTATVLIDELLRHIAKRSGLLIPRSTDAEGNTVYGFTHLSFLEFFAAEWLGKEFERLQKRLARRAEALADGLELTDAALDREFPAPQSIEHKRAEFSLLAATPAWHEPLIFLLESRKNDASTLLRWLFPVLHAPALKHATLNVEPETPLLPVEAVKLAIQLAHDQELALSPATRQSWLRILWSAYLEWRHPPWGREENQGWPIAPLLLEHSADREQAIRALVEVYGKRQARYLYLYKCYQLTSDELSALNELNVLNHLFLDDCTGLQSVPNLDGLKELMTLSLRGCTGLQGTDAFHGLTQLSSLCQLYLDQCTGLESLPDLSALQRLHMISLWDCVGIRSAVALSGLTGLAGLRNLMLAGCKRLESLPDLRALRGLRWLNLQGCTGLKELGNLKSQLHPDCEIIGPDGKRL